MSPESFGRYQVIERLGGGGMGDVFKAKDPDLDREVAVKHVKLSSSVHHEEWYARFKREVQAGARLNHPNLITVYDVDLDHSPPYVVTELLLGGALYDYLRKKKPHHWKTVLLTLYPLGEALAYAHQVGIVHRDLKPQNIMFDENNQIKLVDFGLAHRNDDQTLTNTGVAFGTVGYMSPEQAKGKNVDARTDIFALGIVLTEFILGRNPLRRDSALSTYSATVSDKEIDISDLSPQIPDNVLAMIRKAIAKDRNERYATMELMLEDWKKCLHGEEEDPTQLSWSTPSSNSGSTADWTNSSKIVIETGNIFIPRKVRDVLETMFPKADRLSVERQFGAGLSGGYVYRLRATENGRQKLPTVVKVAHMRLIREEKEAYRKWVGETLPHVAQLDEVVSHPPTASVWDGLRYKLVGGGTFEVQSLYSYAQQASKEQLHRVLNDRLQELLGMNWWFDNKLDNTLWMQHDYDRILPINIWVEEASVPADVTPVSIGIETGVTSRVKSGDYVRFSGMKVTEADSEKCEVTFNIDTNKDWPVYSYRVRLVGVDDIRKYNYVRSSDEVIVGRVVKTRHEQLVTSIQKHVSSDIDDTMERISLPQKPEVMLPNPLQAYEKILYQPIQAKYSIIHGDLNLENILVDPGTGEVNLIDFATVRQGHAIHDLLRLETEVVSKLIPEALQQAELPVSTMRHIYHTLYFAAHHANWQATLLSEMPPPLEKPLMMLIAIRAMARDCLVRGTNWNEYYKGLMLYLLGALKFKNLDEIETTPSPKEVLFWTAAVVTEIVETPPVVPPPPPPIVVPVSKKQKPEKTGSAMTYVVVLTLLVAMLVGGYFMLRSIPSQPGRPPGALPGILTDVTERVTIDSAGQGKPTPIAEETTLVFEGDTVATSDDSGARLLCNCKQFAIGPNANYDINCHDPESTFYDQFLDEEASEAENCTTQQLLIDTKLENQAQTSLSFVNVKIILKGIREDQQTIPLLLSPRETAIIETRPTFTWRAPITGSAEVYQLYIERPGEERELLGETSETELSFPADAAPLEPGQTYEISLFADGKDTSCERAEGAFNFACTELSVLDADAVAEVNDAIASVQTLGLSDVGEHQLLAQVYQQNGLFDAALNELNAAAAVLPSNDIRRIEVHQSLGDLYFRAELYTLAEENYQTAFEAAEARDDAQAQGDATVGLANVATALEEEELTTQLLSQAEATYQTALDDALTRDDVLAQASAKVKLANIALAQEEDARVYQLLREAEMQYRTIGLTQQADRLNEERTQLLREAASTYEIDLENAKIRDDAQAQGDATVGLANVAMGRDQIEHAVELLTEAEALYREADAIEQADEVVAKRAELEAQLAK